MASIVGLQGFNKSGSAVNKLLATYGNDIVDLSTGTGYGLGLTTTYGSEFEVFQDRVFHQNYSNRPITFNGTVWSTEYVGRCLTSKYIKNFKDKSRLFLANCKFTAPQIPNDTAGNPVIFPSRVFYADLYYGNQLTWGIEWGTNGKTIGGTPIFELAQPLVQDFKFNNIKVGDPLFITSGNAQLSSKMYFVASIPSAYRLIVTENFPVTATSLHFWVGSNWYDVATDDNDQLTGMGDNSGRKLDFKLMSLWYYTGSQLKQVTDALGTSSQRSVINKKGYTYYFHGSDPYVSGIYKYDGVSSTKVSKAIDPYIQGMSTANYDDVVSWEEGEEIRFYIGDLTNTNHNISMTNAVATYHTGTGAWDVSPIADVITARTYYRTSNQKDTYCGTNDAQVLQMHDGYDFNGTAINANLDTKVRYPSGTDVLNTFTKLQVIGRAPKGTKVKYKLYNTPKLVDDNWIGLGELSADKTELDIPIGHNKGCGYALRFEDIGSLENDSYIEKVTMFYRPEQTRMTK